MAGRKRKSGPREPNGQPSRKDAEQRYSPAAVKRLCEAALLRASDSRLGSEIGRLLLNGDLTARQAAAGWRWAEISAEYSKAVQSPQCKTARLERGQRGHGAEEGTAAGEAEKRALVRAARRHGHARGALDGCGVLAARSVDLLIADVALLTYEQLQAAREGLDALARLFAAD